MKIKFRLRMTKRRISTRRKDKGFALIAVMTVSAFALLLLFSLAAMSASILQTEGYFKQKNLGLAGAETGLSYAVKLLNDSLVSGAPPCPIAPSDGEVERLSDLPADLTPQAGAVPSTVRIRVRKLSAENITEMTSPAMVSPLIQKQWNPNLHQDVADPLLTYGDDWQNLSTPSVSYFWMVEVTCYRGIIASSLRAMVVPEIDLAAPNPNSRHPFTSTVVANSTIQLGSPTDGLLVLPMGNWVEPNGTNADFRANLQTNGKINIGDNSLVLANLTVSNPTNGAPSSVVSGQPYSIFGRISANTSVDPTPNLRFTPGSTAGTDDNVLALADLFYSGQDRLGANLNPVNPTAGLDPQAPLQVPYAGRNSALLPSFPQDDGSGTASPDIELPAADYVVNNSIDSSNAISKLVVNSPMYSNPTGKATRIFINPDTAADSAVNINSSFFQNQGTSTNLQIYYAGNKPININLTGTGEFKGLIYAPNSTVSTTGVGDFYGAIVANNVSLNHFGSLQLDPESRNVAVSINSGSAGGGTTGGTGAEVTPSKYRVASWQQVNGGIVPQAQ